MVIFKYPLDIFDEQSIEMPDGATLLCVQCQNDDPKLWAMVNENAPLVRRRIAKFATGEKFDQDNTRVYVGTYQCRDGQLVFHVFDMGAA